ncbi:hypothetical protein POTOM_026039 [Populus tomentosa]|uniref:Uncharacterized protein n=1 Tax=Populus tomentosa TaxID=118781 RepID=A0A8X8CP63_POPTO|nr:hypothetical protein POTOM_026039 [Populus tomentosa]
MKLTAVDARGGMETLWPALQLVYMTRASAYRDALKSLIQGYQELRCSAAVFFSNSLSSIDAAVILQLLLAEDHGSAEASKKLLLNVKKRWQFLLLLVLFRIIPCHTLGFFRQTFKSNHLRLIQHENEKRRITNDLHNVELNRLLRLQDRNLALATGQLLQVAVPFSFLCYVSKEVSLRLIQEHRKQKLDKEKAKWNEEILT